MFRNLVKKTVGFFLKPSQSTLQKYKEAQNTYDLGDKKKSLEMFKKIVSEDGLFKIARAQVGKISGEIRKEEEEEKKEVTTNYSKNKK